MTNLPQCDVKWLGIRPSHRETHFTIAKEALLPLTKQDNDEIAASIKRLSYTIKSDALDVLPLVSELIGMQTEQIKFEVEALCAFQALPIGCSPILQYIMKRLADYST